MRVGPTAGVSGWMLSVAEVLPLPHLASAPYTLGEAVAELGDYARAVDASEWNSGFRKKNRQSLRHEISVQADALGRRLREMVGPLLDELADDSDPEAIVATVANFNRLWHSEAGIGEAFADLCDAAQVPGATSRRLRRLSMIVASQVGPAARDSFSLLREAAEVLVSTEEDLVWRRGEPLSELLTEARRLEMAAEILIAVPVGQVVVWTLYYRATISGMREVAGPMTFLRPEWALSNAFDSELHNFPERAELREIRGGSRWLDDLHDECLKPEHQTVLVRVDLGERQAASAAEEAQRRIDAILAVAAVAGGASWQHAGAATVLLDGKVWSSSLGLVLRPSPVLEEDSYGIRATAQVVSSTAKQLGDALTKGPMPAQLVEALNSLREAQMTDHRDVLFYGTRPVTPRVATALEDHAMELFASGLDVRAEDLAIALQRRESLSRAGQVLAHQLMAPFRDGWSREHHEKREKLERKISKFDSDQRVVSIAGAVALRDEIRELPMTELQRADFEEAIAISTNPAQEQLFVEELRLETELLRARHRRVRNAVNHGLPLNETTLNSIRDFAENTSSAALNIALTSFKTGDDGPSLLAREEIAWTNRIGRIERGLDWAADDKQATDEP